jgi:hypothetical protein
MPTVPKNGPSKAPAAVAAEKKAAERRQLGLQQRVARRLEAFKRALKRPERLNERVAEVAAANRKMRTGQKRLLQSEGQGKGKPASSKAATPR